MTAILYTILGLSLGVGATLIYLQERFIRERRLILALSESEKAKSAKTLKDLDEKWEKECADYKKQLQEKPVAPTNETRPEDINKIVELEGFLLEGEKTTKVLQEDNKKQQGVITGQQHEINDLQGEIAFLKGELTKLEDENRNKTPDDFLVLAPPGGHLLPGSVARAFMASGHQESRESKQKD